MTAIHSRTSEPCRFHYTLCHSYKFAVQSEPAFTSDLSLCPVSRATFRIYGKPSASEAYQHHTAVDLFRQDEQRGSPPTVNASVLCWDTKRVSVGAVYLTVPNVPLRQMLVVLFPGRHGRQQRPRVTQSNLLW